ncbi:MAG: hypothetical protein J6V76_01055, partial [Bacteroidales bacterium]|nr:hypothetical protein [Bacteroidales bacterium]
MKTHIPHHDSFQPTGKQPIILFDLSLIFALSILLPTKSLAQEKEAYVVVNGTTLTFYCDNKRGEKTTTTYGIDDKNGVFPKWLNTEEVYSNYWETRENSYTTVIFHESFANATPTSCAYWFRHSPKLTTIENIEYLH